MLAGAAPTINANGNATIASVLAGSNGLTKTGSGTLTISMNATYSGNTYVNAGTMWLNEYDDNYAGGIFVNNGGTLALGHQDIWGPAFTYPAVVVTVNAGGVVTSNGVFNMLNNPVLNGGTLAGNGGAYPAWQAFGLEGTVTVGGTSASSIQSAPGGPYYCNAVDLGNQNGSTTTFNVAHATGNANPDLIVSIPLINSGNQDYANFSALTKTGAGTMVLCSSNAYTGATTVAAGVLALDFSQPTAPVNNIIANGSVTAGTGGSALALGGGALNLIGSLSAANSQWFNGTTINAGASSIALANANSNSLLLNLGAIAQRRRHGGLHASERDSNRNERHRRLGRQRQRHSRRLGHRRRDRLGDGQRREQHRALHRLRQRRLGPGQQHDRDDQQRPRFEFDDQQSAIQRPRRQHDHACRRERRRFRRHPRRQQRGQQPFDHRRRHVANGRRAGPGRHSEQCVRRAYDRLGDRRGRGPDEGRPRHVDPERRGELQRPHRR